MKDARVAEFKAKLSEYLRLVRRGQVVTVYDRNEPIARVVPYVSSGPLVVREAVRRYRTLKEIPLPPPLRLDGDIVDVLLDDRRGEE